MSRRHLSDILDLWLCIAVLVLQELILVKGVLNYWYLVSLDMVLRFLVNWARWPIMKMVNALLLFAADHFQNVLSKVS